jgi:hypothetical protein
MIRGLFTLLSFLSPILFPWPLTIILVLITALAEPLVPLAVGLFADTLYYNYASGAVPVATVGGAVLTIAAFIVRSRLRYESQ